MTFRDTSKPATNRDALVISMAARGRGQWAARCGGGRCRCGSQRHAARGGPPRRGGRTAAAAAHKRPGPGGGGGAGESAGRLRGRGFEARSVPPQRVTERNRRAERVRASGARGCCRSAAFCFASFYCYYFLLSFNPKHSPAPLPARAAPFVPPFFRLSVPCAAPPLSVRLGTVSSPKSGAAAARLHVERGQRPYRCPGAAGLRALRAGIGPGELRGLFQPERFCAAMKSVELHPEEALMRTQR